VNSSATGVQDVSVEERTTKLTGPEGLCCPYCGTRQCRTHKVVQGQERCARFAATFAPCRGRPSYLRFLGFLQGVRYRPSSLPADRGSQSLLKILAGTLSLHVEAIDRRRNEILANSLGNVRTCMVLHPKYYRVGIRIRTRQEGIGNSSHGLRTASRDRATDTVGARLGSTDSAAPGGPWANYRRRPGKRKRCRGGRQPWWS